MKESTVRILCHRSKFVIVLVALVALTAIRVSAQSASEADAMQQRLLRARALAAAHNLTAAASELDNIRKTATDDSIKDVARIMLMGVYLEAADYTQALGLLEETYAGVAGGNESAIRAYFTLAGQSVKGAREHLDRYKAFGINVANRELPSEALADLDRLRTLLERVAAQARQIYDADAKSTDAVALLEDVSSVRSTLARSREERLQWLAETASARQKLAVNETRIASVGTVPVRPTSAVVAPTTSGTPAMASNNSSSNSPAESNTSARSNTPLTKKTASNSEARPPKPSKQDKPKPQSQSQPTTKPSSQPQSTQPLTAPKDGQPLNVGSLVEKATQRTAPSYPMTAKTARVSGVVKVFIIVDESGQVAKIERSDGPALLRGAAESAAKQWKFQPLLIDGQPVRMIGFISFNFTL